MPDSVSLTCPNCAGRLEILPDVERFACMYCGTELIVKRGGGIILLNTVIGGVPKIESSIGPTASEPTQTPPDTARTAAETPQVQSGVERTASEMDRIQSGIERSAAETAKVQSDTARTAAEVPKGQPGVERTASEMDRIQSGLERTAAEPAKGQPGVERAASEMAKIQSGIERTATEPAKGQSEAQRTAAAQAIQRLEAEITAISGQLNDLTAQMQQALANLATTSPTVDMPPLWDIPTGSVPFYLQWFQSRAWWKSLLGGVVMLTAVACLFFCAVAVVDPGQPSSTSDQGTGDTASAEEKTFTSTGTTLLCLCCAAYPLLLLVLFYGVYVTWSRQRKIKRKNEDLVQNQGPLFAVEQEARRAELVRDFQARRAPLEAELDKKKQQLAEHRRVVGG